MTNKCKHGFIVGTCAVCQIEAGMTDAREIELELEVGKNAEGDILAALRKKDADVGYRISGQKGWGGTIRIAKLIISGDDLIKFIDGYATEIRDYFIESHLAALAAKDAEIERRGKILSDAETELYAYGYEDGALISESVKDLCVKALSLQQQVNQQAAEIERLTQDNDELQQALSQRNDRLVVVCCEQRKQIEQLQARVKELRETIVEARAQSSAYVIHEILDSEINHPGG